MDSEKRIDAIEAVEDLADAQFEAAVDKDILEHAVEAAQENQERAEETAEMLAAAAMETARGHEIENLRKDFEKWQNDQWERLHRTETAMQEIQAEISKLSGQIAALATLEASGQISSSSIPIASETGEEAIAVLEEVIPANLSESVEAANPAPEPARRNRRWI